MVVDKSDSGLLRRLDERTVKNGSHIKRRAFLTCTLKVKMQGHIKQMNVSIVVQVDIDIIQVLLPVLAHTKEIGLVKLATNVRKQVCDEAGRDVLHGVDAEAVNIELFNTPLGPALGLGDDIRMVVVNVIAHEIVKVAVFSVHVLGKALVLALDLEHRLWIVDDGIDEYLVMGIQRQITTSKEVYKESCQSKTC